jgi:WD40 repeat protein
LILTDRLDNHEFDLSPQRVTAIAFSPDGESFLAAGDDGRVTVWNSSNGELMQTVLAQSEGLRSIAVSPMNGSIAVGGCEGAILLLDPATGKTLTNTPRFSAPVNCVRFSPDGRQLAVAAGDWMSDSRGDVTLLNVADGKFITRLECASVPGAISFASNEELIVGQWNGHAQLWNLNSVQVVGSARTDKNLVAAAAFSPDNPALREISFEAALPANSESTTPFSMIRELLGPRQRNID